MIAWDHKNVRKVFVLSDPAKVQKSALFRSKDVTLEMTSKMMECAFLLPAKLMKVSIQFLLSKI